MRVQLDRRAILRMVVQGLKVHDTPDVRRLLAKLQKPGQKQLFRDAEILIGSEGLLTEYEHVDVASVGRDLRQLLDIQVGREDILSWARDYRAEILRTYTPARLDWLWDFSWSYSLWGGSRFKARHVLVYGAVRGCVPSDMHNVPFQAALNSVRKGLIRKRERSIFISSRRGDLKGLIVLGLSEEQARKAIEKVVRASV